ncbi:MAG: asparagine synthase (glutamine-hydrolyzing) [Thermoanaerobaculia bacterium]
MCGISAIAGFREPVFNAALERMVACLSHRGPDASGSAMLAGCNLGHTRLSVIDLSAGAQPMADASGRYWITFNGEIYNYRELREELVSRGHPFRTQSDTEVLLRGFAEWGTGLLDRLRGMFAFAIWDSVEQRLFAARDLFGEKPLYYATTPGGLLLLASEIKAITASQLLKTSIDPVSVDAYLAFGYVPPDRTIHRQVQTLPPGHYLVWQNGQAAVSAYWRPRLETRGISLQEAAEELRRLLRRAVERQMIADVPVGAFLSGGLDSSTIVALMQEHSALPVKTFSVGFGSNINELPYAREVADRYGTEHHEIDLGEPDVATLIQRMSLVYDEPFADSSNIPTYLLSEYARRWVKVVLSGDGGDELFGGYWWYAPLLRAEQIAMPLLQWMVLRIVSRLQRHRNRAVVARSYAARLAARWSDPWTRDVMCQSVIQESDRRRLWAGRDVDPFVPGDYYRPSDDSAGLNRAFHFDLTSYLPGDILLKVDRAAMAHGLETRAPFLDRDLVEFALSLPSDLKVSADDTKIVLKEACRQYWPQSLWRRPKQGFGAPVAQWLQRADMQPLLNRVFGRGSHLRSLLPGLDESTRHERNYRTWFLLTLGLWLEAHDAAA